MTLSLAAISVGSSDVAAAQSFYSAVLSPTESNGRILDLHGTGKLAIDERSEPAGDLGGYVVSYVLAQPTEVENVLDAAARNGATVLKPAKKSLFGAFSAVFEAPDGSIWKLSAPTKKDTGPAKNPAVPTETAALLGVESPKASKAFYAALGMITDRDYGNKYIDFAPTAGACRLGLMQRKALAKDVGVNEGTSSRAVFVAHVGTRDELDSVLSKATAAGGRVTDAGQFEDPDGTVWRVVTA